MGIGVELEKGISTVLDTFVTSKSAALCGVMAPVLLTASTVYMIWMGFSVARGEANDPLHTVLWKAFRMAMIFGVALSAGAYQSVVLDAINGIQGAFLQAIGGVTSVGQLVDNMAIPFNDLGTSFWTQATLTTIPSVSILAAAAMVAVAEVWLFAIGLGLFLIAKVSLALVFAVGPAFIACMAFPASQKYTESWIGQALNFSLVSVFVVASVSMLMSFASQFAANALAHPGAVSQIKAATSLLIVSVALGVVVLSLPVFASALSGGASVSGIGRALGSKAMDLLTKKDDPNPKPEPAGGDIKPTGDASASPGSGSSNNGAGNSGGSGAGSANAGAGKNPLYQRDVVDKIKKSA
jgi:type IV secretion system protein VirB6